MNEEYKDSYKKKVQIHVFQEEGSTLQTFVIVAEQ